MSHVSTGASGGDGNLLVGLTEAVEGAAALDAVADLVRPYARTLIRRPLRRNLLEGQWLGHALHPLMTDLPLGFWMSGTVLDLLGRTDSGRLLIGLGVAAAVPTAVTGAAEFGSLEQQRDRRTGSAHALLNSAALGCYAAAWLAHRRGRGVVGTLLAVAGGTAATAGGYLGGHLAVARQVSTRHPAFEDE